VGQRTASQRSGSLSGAESLVLGERPQRLHLTGLIARQTVSRSFEVGDGGVGGFWSFLRGSLPLADAHFDDMTFSEVESAPLDHYYFACRYAVVRNV
jgi:hypothetical protein